MAKLWTLRNELQQALFRNIEFIEVEVDSKAVVDMINNDSNNSVYSPFVHDCKQ